MRTIGIQVLIFLCFLTWGWGKSQGSPVIRKFIARASHQHSVTPKLPVFITFPDSLCGLEVEHILFNDSLPPIWRKNLSIQACLDSNQSYWPFLSTMRAFVHGEIKQSFEGFVSLRKFKKPSLLQYCTLVNQGVLKFLAGEPKRARKDFIRAQAASPWDQAALRNLFSLYFSMGWLVQADSLVEHVMTEKRGAFWAQQYKINLIQFLGTRSDLLMYLAKKSSWRDSLFEIQIAYGMLLKQNNQLALAEKYFARGLEGNPKNGMGWLELAQLYQEQNRLKHMWHCMRMGIEAGTNNPIYFDLLAHLMQEQIFITFDRLKKNREKYANCILSWAPGACREYYENAAKEYIIPEFQRFRKTLEHAFLQGFHSRAIAQQLVNVYGGLGLKTHADNLRAQFWFHFRSPAPHRLPFGLHFSQNTGLLLNIQKGGLTERFQRHFLDSDVYEAFLGPNTHT